MPGDPLRLQVRRARSLEGTLRLPGDRLSAAHALLLAAVSEGESRIRNVPSTAWVRRIIAMVEQMGCGVEVADGVVTVQGTTVFPEDEVPFRPHHETVLMALGGLFVAARSSNLLWVSRDAVSGAHFRAFEKIFDVEIVRREAGETLCRVRSLQNHPAMLAGEEEQAMKTALLYHAFLSCEGCALNLRRQGPDDLERLLPEFGVEVTTSKDEAEEMDELERRSLRQKKSGEKKGFSVSVAAGRRARGAELELPGDVTLAGALTLAATLLPGRGLLLEDALAAPARNGFLTALRRMGAEVETVSRRERRGFPVSSLRVTAADLKGRKFDAETLAGMRDEIPLLVAAAAFAEGETVLRHIGFLREFDTDRLKGLAAVLKELRIGVGEMEDGLVLKGRDDQDGHAYTILPDGATTLAWLVCALKSHGASTLEDARPLAEEFPSAVAEFTRLAKGEGGACVQVVASPRG